MIIVDGEFNDVAEDNRLGRTVIGFGAGASILDTDVYVVYRTPGAGKQIMPLRSRKDARRGGHRAPRAGCRRGAVAVASLGAKRALSAPKVHKSSMDSLADMSAGQIAIHLIEHFGQQGWTRESRECGIVPNCRIFGYSA